MLSCIGGVRSHIDYPGNTLRLADVLVVDKSKTYYGQNVLWMGRVRWEIRQYNLQGKRRICHGKVRNYHTE